METSELLSRFDAQAVLVLGDVFIDEYLSGDCSRMSPEAPVPILKVDGLKTRRVLGGAANTAANIASLGGRAILLGLVGEDSNGQEFVELARTAGIAFLPVRDGRPTIKKTRLLGQRQQLLRLDYEETHPVSAGTEKAVLASFRRQLPEAALVVVSDYAKGFLTESLTQALIRETHEAGKEIVIDPRPQHLDYYNHCDYLTPNWKESLGLLGQPEQEAHESAIQECGEALQQKLKAHILMTLGAKGISFFEKPGPGSGSGRHFNLPTQAREVFDVSGAGDTVVAAFALAKAAGASHEEAVRLANQAAGVVVAKLGTATVTRDEILDGDFREHRLIARKHLARLSQSLKGQGKKVVTLNGSFDLLHAGHLHIIEEARKQGDVLIVGLNSDASIRKYKGEDRPIVPEAQRSRMLLALRSVDFVHIFNETVPMPFLEEVKPDVHVNGSEYGENCVEAPTVKAQGGRIHIVKKIPGLSTSEILGKIRASG